MNPWTDEMTQLLEQELKRARGINKPKYVQGCPYEIIDDRKQEEEIIDQKTGIWRG